MSADDCDWHEDGQHRFMPTMVCACNWRHMTSGVSFLVTVDVESPDPHSDDPEWFADLCTGALAEYGYSATFDVGRPDA